MPRKSIPARGQEQAGHAANFSTRAHGPTLAYPGMLLGFSRDSRGWRSGVEAKLQVPALIVPGTARKNPEGYYLWWSRSPALPGPPASQEQGRGTQETLIHLLGAFPCPGAGGGLPVEPPRFLMRNCSSTYRVQVGTITKRIRASGRLQRFIQKQRASI
jgi:hypothetical protein